MCVLALSFGNVAFALTTPKTIRGCVTVASCLTLKFSMQNNAIVQLTVDLIKAQFELSGATGNMSRK